MNTKKTYYIDYYKTERLTPAELESMNQNQRGIWLYGGTVEATNSCEAHKIWKEQEQNKFLQYERTRSKLKY